ncbi:hypothetical protein AVEN_243465-1, partial [Araneus ventricosus]
GHDKFVPRKPSWWESFDPAQSLVASDSDAEAETCSEHSLMMNLHNLIGMRYVLPDTKSRFQKEASNTSSEEIHSDEAKNWKIQKISLNLKPYL